MICDVKYGTSPHLRPLYLNERREYERLVGAYT